MLIPISKSREFAKFGACRDLRRGLSFLASLRIKPHLKFNWMIQGVTKKREMWMLQWNGDRNLKLIRTSYCENSSIVVIYSGMVVKLLYSEQKKQENECFSRPIPDHRAKKGLAIDSYKDRHRGRQMRATSQCWKHGGNHRNPNSLPETAKTNLSKN